MKKDKISLFGASIGSKVSFKGDTDFILKGVFADNLSIKEETSGELITIKAGSVLLTGDFSGMGLHQNGTVSIDDCKLVQKPLSALTDIQAYHILKLQTYGNVSVPTKLDFRYGKDGFECKVEFDGYPNQRWESVTVDSMYYLKGHGYAVPFMRASVEEQIEEEWVQLEEQK